MNRGGMDPNMEQYLQLKMMIGVQTQIMMSCYSDCVTSYRDSTLSVSEQKCVQNCAARNMGTMEAFQQIGEQMAGRM